MALGQVIVPQRLQNGGSMAQQPQLIGHGGLAFADALGGLIDGLNAKGIIAARVGDVLGGMV